MGAVDGLAAAEAMKRLNGALYSGLCLKAVWDAYAAVGATSIRGAPTALRAWELSEGKHPGDRNPPPGVPVWWDARPNSLPGSNGAAGDVVISVGEGNVVATDGAGIGVIGVMTIDQRQNQIGRPYLGWSECIFEQQIIQGDDMNPDQVRQIIREELERVLLVSDGGRSVVGSSVWNHRMGGEAFPGNADAAPNETAGERLRNIRRSTQQLKGRTVRIEEKVTEGFAALENPADWETP